MKNGVIVLGGVLLGVCLFLIGMLVGLFVRYQYPLKCERSYVGEELYMMTDAGLTKAKVFQQDLFEWGTYYYIDNGSQTYALDYDAFMKLWGQQKDLKPRKK